MSAASLPAYVPLGRTPTYTTEPGAYEQQLAFADRVRPRPSGQFVKQSRSGDACLRLTAQEDNVALPVYGTGGCVEGIVELTKTDGVTSVEVKVEGRLKLKEVAEGGTSSIKLCLDSTLLWVKDPNNYVCPSSLRFSLNLPRTFTYDGKTYPLPPTYDVKLSGLPGFTASIDYSVTAAINKPNLLPNLVPLVRSSIFGISIGNTTLSTPFIYYPRSRPATPLPVPLRITRNGFTLSPEWCLHESVIATKVPGGRDIHAKLYIPASRIFCMTKAIPFHLTLESSAYSLAAFLPFSPMTNLLGKRLTRLSLMRQSTVDVRNEVILGTKTDIWRVDTIGDARFRHAADGPTWVSFTGEVIVDEAVKVGGFKAGGLSVKDCLVLSMTPPEPQKSPFAELRLVIPVRLTMDPWVADGAGLDISYVNGNASEYSVPSTPDEVDA